MAMEITLDALRGMAVRAGLKLSDEELQKLLPGVNRAREQVAEVRQLITDNSEPASAFSALKEKQVWPA
jgi:benzoyl-CoA reductase/2-hydroxyglutaryl-CoA dehydratase subunit BcrC/BadD/HgdB